MANEILITTESLKAILPVYEDSILEQVRNGIPKAVEPEDSDIPKVFITGKIPLTKDYVYGELEYISTTARFHSYTCIKLQGTSSMAHPKKNFTIKLYKDENRSIELKKEFKNWGYHNDFVLKADYIDILHARNVVCAKLWSKVVESRPDYDTLPEELKASPNNGAIDGFPVKVYVHGRYEGLYNWTIPKCAWQFGMDERNENHVVLSSEFNDNRDEAVAINPCNFNILWGGNDKYFDIEVGKLTDNVIDSVNNIINSLLNEDKESLEEFLDIQSAIDYYIFQNVILGIDGLAKNMLISTYDMKKWHLNAYDMDSTLDLHWEGYLLNNPYADIDSEPFLNAYSKLLDFILNEYKDEYKTRYIELRQSVLSDTSIINEFEEYVRLYGDDLYIQDTIPYPNIPSVTNNTINTLKRFIKNRLIYLDMHIMEVE